MKKYRVSEILTLKDWHEVELLQDLTCPWRPGTAPKTTFQAYSNGNRLFFRFVASGQNPRIYIQSNSKAEVSRSERVELFFRCEANMQTYYGLEIDPRGRLMDYRSGFYRKFDYNWQWPESLSLQTNIEENVYFVQGSLSLAVLKQLGLLKNNEIQAGIFRGHCTEITETQSAFTWITWVDPQTAKPDFHVPSAFGLLLL
jgi:hypothetical protein